MRRPLPLLLATLAALSAGPARGAGITLAYTVEAAGMTVMRIDAALDEDQAGYRLETLTSTRGVARLLASADLRSLAEGGWRDGRAAPRRYRTEGSWRGEARLTAIDFEAGPLPALRVLQPALEPERAPVPPERLRGTTDMLSALVGLARQAARTGRCDATLAVFDGRRRTEFAVRTTGVQRIAAGPWSGEALRCDYLSRVTDGQRRDAGDEAGEPRPGTVWFARPLPGAPLLPVRVEAPTRWFGTAVATLENAAAAAAAPPEPASRR
ncbi:DUF3108 domain-containing protein [Roseomonas sp. NAR14]|uniref:DUF3108 domain-containing protein n=1 Tax=Roseomonas acroporae TaxID=2937791 RepID=A0A9X1Y6T7_9PROT|nr:DUF3108 domain-containing protein [Roseomonas acroporae]MCK8785034.1 DUF3108 domain-containing protein [Roseomonas acroporae]